MSEKLIDQFTGDGRVFSGADFIADARFTLRTYERTRPTQRVIDGGVVSTFKRHELAMLSTSRPLPIMGSILTLYFGDQSSKLNFYFVSKTEIKVDGTFYQ